MGRTQVTYRRRLQSIRDKLIKIFPGQRSVYHELWKVPHLLSAPSSTFPYADTYAVATFCMLLEAIARVDELKE